MRDPGMATATAAAAKVRPSASAAAAEVGATSATTMACKFRTAGMMAAAHRAAAAMRVKVCSAAGPDLAETRWVVRTHISLAGHRMMFDVTASAIADLTPMFASRTIGNTIPEFARVSSTGTVGSTFT